MIFEADEPWYSSLYIEKVLLHVYIYINFTLQQTTKPPEEEYSYRSSLSLTLALGGEYVVIVTPRPLYCLEIPGTDCILNIYMYTGVPNMYIYTRVPNMYIYVYRGAKNVYT